jgi:hypothetical protein
VSALQWLEGADLLRCFRSLHEVLVRDARAVFQELPSPSGKPFDAARTFQESLRPQVYARDPSHAESMVLAANEAQFAAQLVLACAHWALPHSTLSPSTATLKGSKHSSPHRIVPPCARWPLYVVCRTVLAANG